MRAKDLSTSATIRLAFAGPWVLCVAVAILRARFDIGPIAVNLLWPFLFFYSLAWLFEKASHSSRLLTRDRDVLLVAALLVAGDHLCKLACSQLIPLGESIPVVANRLHIANIHNVHGTWLSSVSGTAPVVVQTLVISILFVTLALLLHGFYSARQRKSFWSVLAYGCLVAGTASAAVDLGARGYVVDYLYLPGLFAADLKDVYLTVFASALIVEALSNPRISVRWLGWREESRELPRLVVEFTRFAVGEIRRIGRSS